HEAPGVFEKLKEVAAHEDFAAAEGEIENAGLGQLVEHALDFDGRHLAVVVMIEITMHAALVAAIGDVNVHGDGHAQVKCLLAHFAHQAHQGASWFVSRFVSRFVSDDTGWLETRRIPWLESSGTNSSASACACTGSTSNCPQ